MAASAPSSAVRAGAQRWWPAALLVALSFAVYANALGNGFVSDDDFQVLGNKLITDYRNIPRLLTSNVWAFAEAETTNYYRPLFTLSYMALYYAFGYNAFAWHVANLLVHIAALLAGYGLLRALADEKLAFVAGLLFALHPVHVEAVVWVAVLTDLACGLALFAGVLAYHRARQATKPWPFYALAALCFALGLLMKETALVFPALLVAYDFFYRRESPLALLRGWARYLPFAAVLAAYVPLRLHALGRFAPSSGMHFQLTAGEMFLSVPVLFAQYVGKLLAPVNLNYYYVYEPVREFGWRPLLAMLLMAGLALLAFGLRSRQPLIAFSIAWFYLTLAPVLSIPNVGENVFTERYLYIPSLAFCAIAAWGWWQLHHRFDRPAARRALRIGLVMLLLFYAAVTLRRNPDWKDDITLFRRTAEQSPGSATIQMNLGYIYYLHGKTDLAIEHYRRSLALDDRRPLTHNNLGNALTQLGRYDEAIAHLRRAIELKPAYFGAWLNLGLVHAARKDWDEAIRCYRRAIELQPKFNEAWTAMGLSYWNQGNAAEAIAAYRRAVELQPDYPEARINLASALSETGQPAEAIEHLHAALRSQPNGPHTSVIHFNLGVNYERQRQWRAALVEYERAVTANPAFEQARQRAEAIRKFLEPQSPAPFSPIPARPF